MPTTEANPPNSPETEQAVLGSLLIDRDAIPVVADWLPAEAFFSQGHQTIYRAMLALWNARKPCDLVTLAALLDSRGKLEQVGGMAYLASLVTITPTSVHVRYYAEQVMAYAQRRALIDAGAALVRTGYQSGDEIDIDGLVGDTRRAVEAFSLPDTDTSLWLSDYMGEHVARVHERWEGLLDEHVVPTGINSLDRLILGGMRPGELIVVGGRPGMGKTAQAWQIAQYGAMATGTVSVFVQLEMSKEALVNRAIAVDAGVPFEVAYSKAGDIRHRERWVNAAERVSRLPIVVSSEWKTTDRILNEVGKLAVDHQIGAVYIDHLGFLNDRIKSDSDERKTAEVIKRCKVMAQTLNVPVIVLSQLNRETEAHQPFLPSLKNLNRSGEIEAAADHVWLVYRRRYYVDKQMLKADVEDYVPNTEWWHAVELIVAKNRNGEVRTVPLAWEPTTMKFHEVAA